MKKTIFGFITSLLLLGSTAYASAPLSFTHHGVLREDGSLVNGEHNISASIIDQNNKVIGSFSDDVEVNGGQYSVTINNIDQNAVSSAKKLFLKVQIDGVDLAPNLELSSVPYALEANHAVTADDVKCEHCITVDHLNFNALQDSALPNCDVNDLLRQGTNSTWKCTSAVTIDDQTGGANLIQLSGNIGVNTASELSNGYFLYTKSESAILKDQLSEDISPCPCDKDSGSNDCLETFTSAVDLQATCYDDIGSGLAYILYERSSYLIPQEGVLAVINGNVGIGTGKPAAPIHVRSNKGADKYESIIADTQPEILLEDLDGSSLVIAFDDGTLSVSSVANGIATELLSLDKNGLNLAGALSSKAVGDIVVNTSNIADESITNDKIVNGTINVTKLDKSSLVDLIYPVGAIFTSTNSQNPGAYLGGTWEAYGAGRVLVGAGAGYAAGSTGGEYKHTYTPEGKVGDTTLTLEQIPAHTHTQNPHSHIQDAHKHTVTINNHVGSFAFTDEGATNFYVRVKSYSGDFSVGRNKAPHVNSRGTPSDATYDNEIKLNASHTVTVGNATPTIHDATATNNNAGGGKAHTHTFTGTEVTFDNMQPYMVVYMWRRTK